MTNRTLTFRLVATSVAWIVGSLVAAGFVLTLLFRDYVGARFDRHLRDRMEEIVAAAEIAPGGTLKLTWKPSDPRFNAPHSGWYWQISRGAAVLARSDSVWRGRLSIATGTPGPRLRITRLVGPGGRVLRAVMQDITLPEANKPFTVIVAGPVREIQRDVNQFVGQLAATLGVLGLGLILAVLFQVRFGLRPLQGMRRALADIRAGRARRLPDGLPGEIRPVVTELNALIDHNEAMLERARTQAGNLAHALKNPLTVIGNEARHVAGARGRMLREQAAVVNARVDRYLSRARAAGAAGILGARAPLAETVEDLRFSMAHLYKDRGLSIAVTGVDGLFFHGDAHDLAEMIGNLMDNACKWARGRVAVAARHEDGRLIVVIDDDGPGIPEDQRTEVLARGRRLDEAVPGSGLGLDIVQDIAGLYRGSLGLGESDLGGLRATLVLPAAM